jgi:diguanylate cyclase (GGDEF)-like protein
MLWLVSDLSLFFAIYLYKHAMYMLFKLPNNGLFDSAILVVIGFITVVCVLFPVEYLHIAISITLAGSATCAMAGYAMYHALIRDMRRTYAALLASPTLIITSVLFVRGITLWLIPDLAKTYFFYPQFDSYELLWVYLILMVLINVAAIGSALMMLIMKIRDLAEHDHLTGLLNRHAISRELMHANKIYRREKTPFSVLLIDVDFFKKVNDSKGHEAGDQAIKHVSQLMKNELRETDRLARYGGEEFLALLTNCELTHAHKVAENLRLKVESDALLWEGEPISLTISIGVCNINQVTNINELVTNADKALYNAKSSGRNKTLLAQ